MFDRSPPSNSGSNFTPRAAVVSRGSTHGQPTSSQSQNTAATTRIASEPAKFSPSPAMIKAMEIVKSNGNFVSQQGQAKTAVPLSSGQSNQAAEKATAPREPHVKEVRRIQADDPLRTKELLHHSKNLSQAVEHVLKHNNTSGSETKANDTKREGFIKTQSMLEVLKSPSTTAPPGAAELIKTFKSSGVFTLTEDQKKEFVDARKAQAISQESNQSSSTKVTAQAYSGFFSTPKTLRECVEEERELQEMERKTEELMNDPDANRFAAMAFGFVGKILGEHIGGEEGARKGEVVGKAVGLAAQPATKIASSLTDVWFMQSEAKQARLEKEAAEKNAKQIAEQERSNEIAKREAELENLKKLHAHEQAKEALERARKEKEEESKCVIM